ncbi:MAG: VOC family protein [Candidatus Nanopelagicales bacterium]|jgi:catechol 2,3-dioxygenase-like lactoylglutathione lyase family enzyme
MAVARDPYTVLDCADVRPSAELYGALLGWEVEVDDDGSWANVRSPEDRMRKIAFQRVEGYRPPQWPGQEHPQQLHVDVWVDDIDAAEAQTLALGAVKHEHQPDGAASTNFRVFLDPAGHPFCLCQA